MSSSPKKGRPRAALDYRQQARRIKALERRKANLARYRAGVFNDNGTLTHEGQKQKIAAAIRDIAGLEANIAKGPTA